MNTKQLIDQLNALNKTISQIEYSEAIKNNNTRTNSIIELDNLEVDAIQNQKYIDRIISVNAMIDFHNSNKIITKCKPVLTKRMKRLYNV
jgi:divalent metal cation (Fe/Co/Zn/Cd) transporter